MIVGGFAVNFHGYHRFTEDIDIWIAVSDENFNRLLKAVRLFFGEDLPGLDKTFLQNNEAVFFGRVPNKIELIQAVSGVDFCNCYPRRIEAQLDGLKVNIISLPDLKVNKRSAGRHKDLADLDRLP